jgi:hypothetical protein
VIDRLYEKRGERTQRKGKLDGERSEKREKSNGESGRQGRMKKKGETEKRKRWIRMNKDIG